MKFALHPLRPGERFVAIADYPRYLIGDQGTVYSTIRSGRFLAATIGTHGYPYVSLMADGASKPSKHLVHRLVASAFLPNPNGLKVVNHIDGCKTNPRIENLEWVSFGENNEHARLTGLNQAFGCNHYAARLSDEAVAEIKRRAASGEAHHQIASDFGIVRQQVTKIASGQAWRRAMA